MLDNTQVKSCTEVISSLTLIVWQKISQQNHSSFTKQNKTKNNPPPPIRTSLSLVLHPTQIHCLLYPQTLVCKSLLWESHWGRGADLYCEPGSEMVLLFPFLISLIVEITSGLLWVAQVFNPIRRSGHDLSPLTCLMIYWSCLDCPVLPWYHHQQGNGCLNVITVMIYPLWSCYLDQTQILWGEAGFWNDFGFQ